MIDFIYELLFSATIGVSLTIVFVLIMKKLLKSVLSPRLHYLLWLLIVIQLIIPVRLNTSEVSPSVIDISEMTIETGQSSSEWIVEPVVRTEKIIYPREALVMMWFIGLGLVSLTYAVVFFREHSRKHISQVKDDSLLMHLRNVKERMGIKKDIGLFYSSKRQSPYAIGIVRPIIVIPKNIERLSDMKMIEYILLHELQHIKKHDLLAKFFYLLVTILFWFNPLVWLGFKLFSDDQELDCDYQVLKYLDGHDILNYGHALLELTVIFKEKNSFAFSNSLLNHKFIGRRIHMISNHKNYTFKSKLLSSFVLMTLSLVMILTSPALAINSDHLMLGESDKGVDVVQASENQEHIKTEEVVQVDDALQLQWPIDSQRITSAFEKRSLGFHTGVDVAAASGSKIYAAEKGTVIYSGFKSTYGKLVIIHHENDVSTRYAHCSELLVEEGESVSKGDIIAYVGNTGRSTGPHLHFEVRANGEAVDPIDFFDDL